MEVTVRPHWMSDRDLQILPVTPGLTLAEAARKIQLPAEVKENGYLVALVNGEVIPRDHWEMRRITDDDVVLFALSLHGGKKGKQILALVASIALTMYVGSAGFAAFAESIGVKSAFALNALRAGTMVLGSLAINSIFAPPSAALSEDDNRSPTYVFSNQANSVRRFGVVPRIYGTHRFAPDVAALPYTVNVGDDTYFYCVYSFGYGPLRLEDFRIGQNSISNYDDVELVVHQEFTSSSQLKLYKQDVWQEPFNSEVRKADSGGTPVSPIIVTTQPATEYAVLDLVFPQGLCAFNDEGGKEVLSTTMLVEYAPYGSGSWTFAGGGTFKSSASLGVLGSWQRGTLTGLESIVDGYGAEGEPSTVWGIAKDTTSFTVSSWDGGVPAAGVRVRVGGYTLTTATVSAGGFTTTTGLPGLVRADEDGGIKFGYELASNNGVWTIESDRAYSLPASLEVFFPTAGQWQIRITKLDDDFSDGDTTRLWRRFVTALKSYKSVVPIEPEQTLTVVELKIRATGQLNGSVEQFSATAHSILPVYDGTGWLLQETSNPAWVYVDILTGSANRRPVPLSRVNLDKMLEWAEKCDAVTGTFTKPMGQCNVVVDRVYTLYELLQSVATTGRAAPSMKDNKYTVIIDNDERTPVQMFTPRNSRNLSSSRTYLDIPHGLRVRWIDPVNNYQAAEITVYDTGYSAANATVLEDLITFGMTDPEQVTRYGRYMLAQGKLRQERFSLDTDVENIVCMRGDLVYVAHDVLQVGGEAARIEAISGSQIVLDADASVSVADFTGGTTFGIRIRHSNGTISSVLTVSALAGDTLTISDAIPGVTAVGDLVVFGEKTVEVGKYTVDRVSPGADLSATIHFEEYAPAVYTAETTGAIPPYSPQQGSLYIAQPVEGLAYNLITVPGVYGMYYMATVVLTWRPSAVTPYLPTKYLIHKVFPDGGEVLAGETADLTFVPDTVNLYAQGGQSFKYAVRAVYAKQGVSAPRYVLATTAQQQPIPPENIDVFDVQGTTTNLRKYTFGFSGVVPEWYAGTAIRYYEDGTLPIPEWADMTPVEDSVSYLVQSGIELTVPQDAGAYVFQARAVSKAGAVSGSFLTVTRTFADASIEQEPSVDITAAGLVFLTPANSTTPAPSTIRFSAVLNGPITSPTYQWYEVVGVSDNLISGATNYYYDVSSFDSSLQSKVYKVVVTGNAGLTVVNDVQTVYSIREGSDALVLALDNDLDGVSCTSDGVPKAGQVAAIHTQMYLALGTTVLTSVDGVTYTVEFESGIDASVSSTGYVTISSITADTGYALLRATWGGHYREKIFTVVKNIDGADGTTAPILNVSTSTLAFAVPKNGGTVTPATATLTATPSAGITSPTYQWYTVSGGTPTIIPGATLPIYVQNAITSGSITLRCVVTGDGPVTEDDEVTLYAVREGDDAIVVALDNPSHTLACDSNGSPKSGQIALATTRVAIAAGFNVASGGTLLGLPVTYAIHSSSGGTANITDTNKVSLLTITGSVAEFVIRVTWNGQTADRTFKVNKSLDGASAINIDLTNESHTVPALADGTVLSFTGASSTATVYVGGADDSSNWSWATATSGCTITGTNTRSVTITAMSANAAYVDFTATRSGYPTQTARFTLTKALGGTDGSDPIVYSIGSSATSVIKNKAGVYTPTQIYFNAYRTVGNGSREDYAGRFLVEVDTGSGYTTNYTSSSNENVHLHTVVSNCRSIRVTLSTAGGASVVDVETIPVVVDGSDGLNIVVVYAYKRAASAPVDNPGACTYDFSTKAFTGALANGWTAAIPAVDGNPLYVVAVTAANVATTDAIAAGEWSTPVKLVEDGADAVVIDLTNEAHTVPASSDGTVLSLTGASTTASVYLGGADDSSNWSWATATSGCTITGTNTRSVTITAMSANAAYVDFTATRSGYPTQTARFTLTKALGGTDAVVYSVSPSVSAVNKSKTGVYTPTSFLINAYKTTGNTRTDYAGRFLVEVDTGSGYTTNYVSSSDENAHLHTVVSNCRSIKVTLYNSGGVTVLDTETVPVVFDGTDGSNVAIVYAYKRAASAPGDNPGACTYDFSTKAFTGALANGWTAAVPAVNGNPLYVVAATAASTTSTDAIAAGEWSTPVKMVEDGTDGSAGLNSATVMLYQRTTADTAPALPSTTATYTFSTGGLTGHNNGWAQTVPASGGIYLWVTTATASATTATDTISSGEWAAARKIAQDGETGYGSNLIPNSDFKLTTGGWSLRYVANAGQGYVWGRDLGGSAYMPYNGHTIGILRGTPPTIAGAIYIQSEAVPVVAGARYEISGRVASNGCTSQIAIGWHNSSGIQIAEDACTAGTRRNGGPNLADYDHQYGFFTAPVGAVFAAVYLISHTPDGGVAVAYSLLTQPMFCRAAANQASPSQWFPSNWTEKIGSGNVEALVEDNAITSPMGATYGIPGSVFALTGSDQQVLSVSMTTAGESVVVSFACPVHMELSSTTGPRDSVAYFELRRGSTVIHYGYACNLLKLFSGTIPTSTIDESYAVAIMDTPAAGTHTYSVYSKKLGADSGSFVVGLLQPTLYVVGLKK